MIKGSTPTHKFILPFSTDIIDVIEIGYAQDENTLITKKTEDCTFEDNTVTVKLKQDETMKFNGSRSKVQIQVRVKTKGGDVLISPIQVVWLETCLFDGVV